MADYYLGGFNDDNTSTRKTFAQRDRMAVWDKEFGIGVNSGLCPICKKHMIYSTHFAMGHKKALADGGDNNLGNIRPICTTCNSQMGTMNMSEYKRKYHSSTKAAATKTPGIKTKPKCKTCKGKGYITNFFGFEEDCPDCGKPRRYLI